MSKSLRARFPFGALLLGLVVTSLGPVAQAQTPPPSTPPASVPDGVVPTISTGDTVDLLAHRQTGAPTVFVFFNGTSSADRELVATLTGRARASSAVGLRLVRLPSLDAPVAKQHKITETPTVLVLDRFGKPLARTSKMEEIDAAVATGLKMARLKWVDERDPRAPEIYKNLGGGRGPVPHILKTMSMQPDWMNLVSELAARAHFSDTALPRSTKELIATYVSGINRCKY